MHFLLAQLVDLFTLLPIIVHVEVPVVKSYTHTARSGGVAVQVASVDPDGGAFDFVSADAPWR